MRRVAAIALILSAGVARKGGMNETIQLWWWVREGFSVALCRVAAVHVEKEGAEEEVRIELQVLERLWCPPGADVRRPSFRQPASEMARLRSPDPVWGKVDLRAGAVLLYVSRGAPGPEESLFAEVVRPDDPGLKAVREILAREAELRDEPAARRAQYLAWLEGGRLVQRLFAGQSLARDPLPGVDQDGDVAVAMAHLLGDDAALPFARLSAVEWLFDHVWRRTNGRGKLEAIRAGARALSAKDANVRRFALDALTGLDPLRLRLDDLVDSGAARLLRERAAELQEPQRVQLELLSDALTPRR